MKRLLIPAPIVVSLCLACSCVTPSAQTGQPQGEAKPLTDEQLWSVYYHTLAKLKPYGIPVDRREHERVVEPERMGWSKPNGHLMVRYSVTLGRLGHLTLGIDAHTGEVRQYHHERLLHVGPPMVYPEYLPLDTKAKLTEKDVKETTESYLFLNTQMPLKEYEFTAKYQANIWRVRFRRTLGGHPFYLDAIYMYYSEKYGLLFYWNRLFSDECDVDKKLTEEDAFAAADKYVQTIVQDLGFNVPMRRDQSWGLQIVNPTIFKVGGFPYIDTVPFKEVRKTRLAWVLDYWNAPNTRPRTLVRVFVDAINGELLGHEDMSE